MSNEMCLWGNYRPPCHEILGEQPWKCSFSRTELIVKHLNRQKHSLAILPISHNQYRRMQR